MEQTADWRRWYSGVSGESFGDRQRVIARLRVGEALRLVREPSNCHDPFAIRVETMAGKQCGYLPGGDARLADDLDAGAEVKAAVADVTGGEPGKPSLGLVIEIAMRR